MGVGSTRRLSAMRWGVAGNIVAAWILTLPAAGLVGTALYLAGEALRAIFQAGLARRQTARDGAAGASPFDDNVTVTLCSGLSAPTGT